MSENVIILAGIGNLGSQHWQSLWEQSNPKFERFEQRDWYNPICEEWCAALEVAAKRAGPNVVVVAHSIACLVVAHWAAMEHASIKAALLVAVPDSTGPNFPKEAVGFSPTPTKPFNFPSTVVVSTNDPYGTLENSTGLSKAWGSHLVDIGNCGHINASSGLGAWPEGYKLLSQLRD